jgi:hypothetical protein
MSFDAGSIVGSLKLDMSEFAHGILESQAIAAVFPASVVEFLEHPLLALIEVAKEAAHFVVEAVESMGKSFHAVGLAAEKAGVDVEWLSRLSGVAQTAGVGLDQLVTGFKILEQRAELANEGDKGATAGFKRLGISASEAAALMATPQALFERVQQGIAAIENPAQRTAAALGVLGRQGYNLAPLLTKSEEELKGLGDVIEELGGTVTKPEAEMGETFGKLEAIIGAAWTGIKKTTAAPILEFITDHFDEIVEKVVEVSGAIREGLSTAFEILGPLVKGVWSLFQGWGSYLSAVFTPLFDVLVPVLKVVGEVLGTIFDWIGKILGVIGDLVRGFQEFFGIAGPATQTGAAAKQPQSGRGNTEVNIHVDGIDADTASSAFAQKAMPLISKELQKQKKSVEYSASQHKVKSNLKAGR